MVPRSPAMITDSSLDKRVLVMKVAHPEESLKLDLLGQAHVVGGCGGAPEGPEAQSD